MIASLVPFGETSYAIWEFAGGVLAFMLVAVLIMTAIDFINRLLK